MPPDHVSAEAAPHLRRQSNRLQPNRQPADRAFGTVVVCSSIVAIGIGAVYWLSRVGFANPPGPVMRTIGLSLFLISAPYAARHAISTRNSGYSWMLSYSFLWLVALFLTAVAGRIAGPGGVFLSVLMGAAGATAFAVTLARWLGRGSLWTSAAILAGSGAFALWTSGVVWGRIYKNPLFFENLAVNGMVHHDSLHLAAFANMLRTYGVASTGLDGLPYIPYHWGTAWLFAQWSNLLGVSVLEFYQLAFPVIMIPFFFGGILAAATEIGNLAQRMHPLSLEESANGSLSLTPASGQPFDIRSGFRPWLVLLVASVGVVPIAAMDAMGVWTSNVVISESYTAAVPAALLLLATTFVFWKTRGHSVTDTLFVLVVLPLGIVALGYLKISLMVLGFLLALYLGVRLGLYRRPVFAAAGLLLPLLVFLTWTRVSLPAHNEGLAPLDFLSGFVPRPWWPLFFVVHLFWSWVFVVLRVWHEGVRTLGDLSAALRERRLLDAEAVVVVALAGVVPGLMIHIDGGSAFYFSDVQRWLSVALLIAGADTLLRRPDWTPAAATLPRAAAQALANETRYALGRTPAVRVLVALIAIPLVISMGLNALRWSTQMLRENAAMRRTLYPANGVIEVTAGIRALPQLIEPEVLQPALRNARNFPVLNQLRALNDLPAAERRRTALFIPQSETVYWSILARPGACTFAPFVAPALSGIAMVDGMPAAGCELSRYYGIGSYTPRARAQTAGDESPPVLCGKARRSGLDRVLVLRFDADGVMQSQRIDC